MAFTRQCFRLCVVTLILFLSYIQSGSSGPAYGSNEKYNEKSGKKSNPLIILMLDGFRWDFYDQHKDSLPNFKAFLDDGVQAKWVNTIFPSLSYACWTTISTGTFPDVNNLSGNNMLDVKALETNPSESEFLIGQGNTTKLLKWWQDAEPIWITATKHKKKSFLRLWSRCDVPYHGVLPKECLGYEDTPYLDSVQEVRDACEIAILKLFEGFQLVMIYGNVVDDTGHVHGPESPEMLEALIGVDGALGLLLDGLKKFYLEDKVNWIIVGDHGLKFIGPGSGVKRIFLDDYIKPEEVIRIVDDGAIANIATEPNRRDEVYNKLKDIEGMKVYKREDIPKKYHIKDAKYTLDILCEADEDYLIRGLVGSPKQTPRINSAGDTRNGTHGWYNTEDMRTIFFAKGPAFKKGYIASPIGMEDEYQVFAKLLKIPAQPNNGSWSRVKDMFVDDYDDEDEDEYENDSY